MAHDLFVHHFGSRTFAGNGIDAEALLDENERRFAAKWGRDRPRGRRVALQPWSGWPEVPRGIPSARSCPASSMSQQRRRSVFESLICVSAENTDRRHGPRVSLDHDRPGRAR